jgi:hypothetical protein
MTASILFLLPALALTVLPVHAQTMAYEEHRPAAPPAVSEFTTSINRYLELHRLLESPMSSLTMGADLEQVMRAREAHRRALVEARVATPRGDLFTPRVATYIRRQLQMATYEAQRADAGVKKTALQRLPELPNELEYRFVDRDLVLLDMEIDLVVDVLQNALPPEAAVDSTYEAESEDLCAPEPAPAPPVKGSPCLAHPELEMCWS